MRSVSILSVASLLALATAQPAVKRDAITVTEVKTVITTIDITKTVYAGEATPVPNQPPVHQHHSHHHPRPVSSVVSPSPVQPTIIPDSSLEQAQPTKPHTHVHTHTRRPPPPPPTTPTPVPTPTPTPSPPQGGGVPSDALVGEGTFYSPGLGSCGETNTESDFIVALSLDKMNNGANPNDNPICGQKIHIVYNGVHQTAVVTDSCYACALDDIDMTPGLFDTFADETEGRLTGVKWWFENPSYM